MVNDPKNHGVHSIYAKYMEDPTPQNMAAVEESATRGLKRMAIKLGLPPDDLECKMGPSGVMSMCGPVAVLKDILQSDLVKDLL